MEGPEQRPDPDSEPQPCQDYRVVDSSIPRAEAESRLNSLFESNSEFENKLSDQTICEISDLLRILELPVTSPRLYIVLRSIGHLEALDRFITNGITDFWFPFHTRTLPTALGGAARSAFLRRQWVVLTKSIDLEKGADGVHHYLGPEDVVPFESQGRLGEGSYGAVDRVRSTLTGAVYARKRIRRSDKRNMHSSMEMFQKEVSTMKNLDHQHVVKLIGSYTDPVYAAFIISPVADSNLEQFLSDSSISQTPSKLSILRTFFGCLARGLEYMHQNSVRHKDIKPMNILVKGETVLYTDFGLALDWTDAGKSTTQDSSPAMTRTYSAPELLTDAPRNSATDIWSLGCVFAELLWVLRGSPVSILKHFLQEIGTKSTIYAQNIDGLEISLTRRRTEPGLPEEEEAYRWVKSMLMKAPHQRPTAESLCQKIGRVPGFIGGCCKTSRQSMALKRENRSTGHVEAPDPSIKRLRLSALDTATDTSSSGNLVADKGAIGEPAPSELVICPPQEPELLAQASSSPGLAFNGEPKNPTPSLPGPLKAPSRRKATPSPSSLKASLFAAVEKGDIAKVQAALAQGADINDADYSGETALMRASEKKDRAAVLSFLLREGADPRLKDSDGATALHVAAGNGNCDAIDLLINAGASINVESLIGGLPAGPATPLQLAVLDGGARSVEKLVNAGADINLRLTDGGTPLTLAALTGHDESVEILLSAGADVNRQDDFGQTPLLASARSGYSKVVEILIKHGADIDKGDGVMGTPLIAAAEGGHVECVDLLLAAGATTDLSDERPTALWSAALAGRTEAVKTLLDHGASIDKKSTREKTTPLMEAASEGHLDTVKLLCNRGAAFTGESGRGPLGNYVLHFATSSGSGSTISYLLEIGANIDARNDRGEIALHLTVDDDITVEERIECARVLLSHGANLASLTCGGATPLDYAISRGDTDMVEFFEDFVSQTA